MYESSAGLEAELHAPLSTADVDLLNIIGFGEMLHVRRAVENGIDKTVLRTDRRQTANADRDITCDIAVDDEEAGAEEYIKTSVEIIEEQVTETSLRILPVFSANKTSDGLGRSPPAP